MKTTAIQKGIHLSSSKANLTCDLVRGLAVTKALVVLDNTPTKAARYIKKLLNQAIANATNNHAMTANALYIYQITANQGRTLKRMIPRAKGSSSSIRKRFITLSITLSDNKDERKNDLNTIKLRLAKRNQHKKDTKATSKVTKKEDNSPRIKFTKGEK